ncbi:type II secretion system protein GspM [uncultured Rhodoferax sp.]|uniref:type II secretion system protein GspM n=1 Tax=uncultured Rhodoferax sp. TaxID=223188 RepID=UPI0025D5B44D|nr:type II secretion system protein GspM [uncultured Rhodoferax sp.]
MNTALHRWWTQRAPREQRMLGIALALVAVALLWWQGLAPALRSLRQWEAQAPQLEAQLQAMRSLQAEAQGLQAQPPLSTTAAQQALQGTLSALEGSGSLVVQDTLATVTLRGTRPQALAQWLARVRTEARLAPSQASLGRDAKGGWSGTLQLPLPGQ